MHNPTEWRLFTHSFKVRVKAVLLHNGNNFPYIPDGPAGHMKDTYNNSPSRLNQIC